MARNMRALPEKCDDDFNAKLVVITGGTAGIGYQTARQYASRGATLLLINRNQEKSVAVCESLRMEFGVECDYLLGDLSRLEDM
ncbi:MAG: SDR family NAD(P)-dependent oxidoreductase, partial [Chloroflexi bacterium]